MHFLCLPLLGKGFLVIEGLDGCPPEALFSKDTTPSLCASFLRGQSQGAAVYRSYVLPNLADLPGQRRMEKVSRLR